MSETGYVIWFIVTCVFVTGLLLALIMRSMDWFEKPHHPHGYVHQLPNEPTSRDAIDRNRQLEQHHHDKHHHAA